MRLEPESSCEAQWSLRISTAFRQAGLDDPAHAVPKASRSHTDIQQHGQGCIENNSRFRGAHSGAARVNILHGHEAERSVEAVLDVHCRVSCRRCGCTAAAHACRAGTTCGWAGILAVGWRARARAGCRLVRVIFWLQVIAAPSMSTCASIAGFVIRQCTPVAAGCLSRSQ
jgi:hypothetical protein